jgi:hypothetical protein
MTSSTRRAFFVRAGAGAALAGVAAAAGPAAAGSLDNTDDAPLDTTATGDQPLVLYVKDVKTGELALLVGEREVIYRDTTTVRRALAAAKS